MTEKNASQNSTERKGLKSFRQRIHDIHVMLRTSINESLDISPEDAVRMDFLKQRP